MMDFIDESLESIAPIPTHFVAFEKDPTILEPIEAAFRPIHSLKGNAAYFGLIAIKNLAHDMETVLDQLRKGRQLPDGAIIDALLAGVDELQHILEETRRSGEEATAEEYTRVLSRINGLASTGTGALGRGGDATNSQAWEMLWDGLAEIQSSTVLAGTPEGERFDDLLALLSDLAPVRPGSPSTDTPASGAEQGPEPGDDVLATMMGLLEKPPPGMPLEDQGERVRACLAQLQTLCAGEEAAQIVSVAIEEMDLFVSKIGFDPMLVDSLIEVGNKLRGLQEWFLPEPEPQPRPAAEPDAPPPEKKTVSTDRPARPDREQNRTMRVSEVAVDQFLGFVGELIAVDEMFRYIHGQMVDRSLDLELTRGFLRVINTFTKLSDDLQNSIMAIRKISVKPMLNKTSRIARDVAGAAGKRIDVHIDGEEISIDRSLIETLEAPLVHLVRNAADHGIEPPDIRLANGKPESGSIRVAMSETDEEIVLRIRDDGKGFDHEKIRAKAVDMGILAEGAAVDERTLVEVVFAPGFSTAAQVTDVSGRGVGMDAVRRNVEDAGGRIEIETEPGKGSEIGIRLPKTIGTQIINSFVISVGGERVVLPTDRITGSFKAESTELHTLPSGGLCISRNEDILPVYSLDGPLTAAPDAVTEGVLIAIETEPELALHVDEILGMQKVVVRPIPWLTNPKLMGAAVMGDGVVSMVVNPDALAAQSP